MDVRYINPFIGAVKHVFRTMLGTDIMISKPRLRAPDESNADVSAVIGFSGDAAGCVILCFRTDAAVKTASKFAGNELTPQHPDFSDALGELANMVAGQAKAQFEGLSVSISLPSVIIGRDHEVLQSKITPRLVIPCDSPLGRFAVEVAMVVEKKTGATASAPVAAVAG
ncbi:MAG TPA: chemotaxis protein CheX [Phycisphaerae bacterium]|nr:chemotaxis protein CheX [Phycisphaerae bacterium]HRR85530.1 chemotaxis protein CheX [Phycisphaerae bacterium]